MYQHRGSHFDGCVTTFVVDSQVILGEANKVVLVLGAPASRQRGIIFVDEWIELLETIYSPASAVVAAAGATPSTTSRCRS